MTADVDLVGLLIAALVVMAAGITAGIGAYRFASGVIAPQVGATSNTVLELAVARGSIDSAEADRLE